MGQLRVSGPMIDLLEMSRRVQTSDPDDLVQNVMDRITMKCSIDWTFLDAEKIIPYPLGEKWSYRWTTEHWGCKSGFVEVERIFNIRSIVYNFQTAWSPASPLIYKMAEMFPTLTFIYTYHEGGNGFQGKIKIAKGELIEDVQGPYYPFPGRRSKNNVR